jgi:endoglucanase
MSYMKSRCITRASSALVLLLLLPFAARAADAASAAIALNQVGYLPAAHKLADAPGEAKDAFAVEDATSGKVVFSGKLGAAAEWAPARQRVRIADFSALRTPGRYRLRIDGLPPSDPFTIADDAYATLAAAALKAFYFNRASTALDTPHAGIYARAEGHPDDVVLVHASAASVTRPAGTVISSPKGWYDAGDYNKYVVNAAVSTHQLLDAYEQFPQVFTAQRLGISESGNGAPDVLNEAWWNLQWMLTMQDPDDGGVYHKLTTLNFSGFVMPDQDRAPRYVVQKSTAAALDLAAVMAQASRVYAPFGGQFPGASQRMLAAARRAWAWAQRHPDAVYVQPADVRTGTYGDAHLDDEFAWAAAELFLATREPAFFEALVARKQNAAVPSWENVAGFAWLSLASHREVLATPAQRAQAETQVLGVADGLLRDWKNSAYAVAMDVPDFVWGSNATALNRAVVLVQAYRLSNEHAYLDAAQSQLDYVLGRNPLGRSFVTGFGARPPLHIHHRVSASDGIDAPVPGWLVGGANPGQEDHRAGGNCTALAYPSALPALSYLDATCAFASNEVAINWNAPLVYVVAALSAE